MTKNDKKQWKLMKNIKTRYFHGVVCYSFGFLVAKKCNGISLIFIENLHANQGKLMEINENDQNDQKINGNQ